MPLPNYSPIGQSDFSPHIHLIAPLSLTHTRARTYHYTTTLVTLWSQDQIVSHTHAPNSLLSPSLLPPSHLVPSDLLPHTGMRVTTPHITFLHLQGEQRNGQCCPSNGGNWTEVSGTSRWFIPQGFRQTGYTFLWVLQKIEHVESRRGKNVIKQRNWENWNC